MVVMMSFISSALALQPITTAATIAKTLAILDMTYPLWFGSYDVLGVGGPYRLKAHAIVFTSTFSFRFSLRYGKRETTARISFCRVPGEPHRTATSVPKALCAVSTEHSEIMRRLA